jgi:hypothetical protein
MKPLVGALLGFVGGVAVGGIATYFGMKAKFEKHANDVIREYREYSNGRIQKVQSELNKIIDSDKFDEEEYNKKVASEPEFEDYTSYSTSDMDDNDTKPSTGISEALKGISVDSAKAIKEDMEALSRDVHDQDFDEHMAERENPEEDISEYDEALAFDKHMHEQAVSEGYSDFPRTISASEMLNQKQWYTKLTFSYYAEDDILADDQDNLVDDPKDLVGEYFTEFFGMNEEDPNVIYIRNDDRETDYEIMKIDESYKDRYPKENVSISD